MDNPPLVGLQLRADVNNGDQLPAMLRQRQRGASGGRPRADDEAGGQRTSAPLCFLGRRDRHHCNRRRHSPSDMSLVRGRNEPPYDDDTKTTHTRETPGLARFVGYPSLGVRHRQNVRPWRGWRKDSRWPFVRPRVQGRDRWLCQRGDRSLGQVARDFDLTETAVREWVKQAERDAGTRHEGGQTTEDRRELAELRRESQAPGGSGDAQGSHGSVRQG